MFMQILLGGIQVILFFVLLFNYDKFSERIQNHLITYGVISTLFLLFFFYSMSVGESPIVSLGITFWSIILIPMSLGTYFTYIVYQLKKQIS